MFLQQKSMHTPTKGGTEPNPSNEQTVVRAVWAGWDGGWGQ